MFYAIADDGRAYELGKGAWSVLADDTGRLDVTATELAERIVTMVMASWPVVDKTVYAREIAEALVLLGPRVRIWGDEDDHALPPINVIGTRYRKALRG